MWFYPCPYICNCLKMPKKSQINEYSDKLYLALITKSSKDHSIYLRGLTQFMSRVATQWMGRTDCHTVTDGTGWVWEITGLKFKIDFRKITHHFKGICGIIPALIKKSLKDHSVYSRGLTRLSWVATQWTGRTDCYILTDGTGWVWEILTGWGSRLQEYISPIILGEFMKYALR